MRYWIVPCRESTFLIDAALKANQDKKDESTFVDWRQSYDFAVGDVVFIYKTHPQTQIRYRMEVIAINLSFDEATDKEIFWKDISFFYDGFGSHKYARFSLLTKYPDGMFSLDDLRKYGLKWNAQSVKECTDEHLLAYLNGSGEDVDVSDEIHEQSSLKDIISLTEGELHEIVCNRYERNRTARERCIEAKGCKCAVCGMDFKQTYGDIGQGFIHVHHLVPISSIGENYEIDPIKDLVPVCPNCHNMLHRKEPPYTPEELKMKLKSKH